MSAKMKKVLNEEYGVDFQDTLAWVQRKHPDMSPEEQERFADYSRLDWSYGNTRKKSLYKENPIKSYKVGNPEDIGVSATSTFQFRSADSFLKSLNNKATAAREIDLSAYNAGVKVFHKKFGEGVISKVEAERR